MAEKSMHALVLHDVGDIRYETVPRPEPAPGEALVRVGAAGVCASDIPRIYEHGVEHYPLIPGHELAGVVEAVNEADVSGAIEPGARVAVKPLIPCGHCTWCRMGAASQCEQQDVIGARRDGGFAEYVRVPVTNLLPLPRGTSLIEAALTEPAAEALHALRQGAPQAGEVVAILGAGMVGMLLAQWAWVIGARRVLLVDVHPHRLVMADDLILGETFDARQGDPVAWARQETDGRGPDLVIEAAGASATWEQALRMARPLGRVVLAARPSADVQLSQGVLQEALHKELTLRGAWSAHDSASPVDEWQVALDMLAEERIDTGAMVMRRVPLSAAVDALEALRDGAGSCGRLIIVNDMDTT
jgi:L-iditol 2-dehydrogenase